MQPIIEPNAKVEVRTLDSAELARKAVDIASDKLASDIVLLDLREVAVFADYFVLLTGESRRQLGALRDDLTEALEREGASLHHAEGNPDAGWVLLDFGDLVIHIFGPEERQFYGLDKLWAHAPELVRIQ